MTSWIWGLFSLVLIIIPIFWFVKDYDSTLPLVLCQMLLFIPIYFLIVSSIELNRADENDVGMTWIAVLISSIIVAVPMLLIIIRAFVVEWKSDNLPLGTMPQSNRNPNRNPSLKSTRSEQVDYFNRIAQRNAQKITYP